MDRIFDIYGTKKELRVRLRAEAQLQAQRLSHDRRNATADGSLATNIIQDQELFFVTSTYRLRDVGETVEEYDEHFWRNGHSGLGGRRIRRSTATPSTAAAAGW